MKNYLIGISGGSGAGKTTIVKSLVNYYENKTAVLELDSYYKDFSDLTFDDRGRINFDHPKSFDYEMLKDHIYLLLKNKKIKSPIYDYKKHKRKKLLKTIYPNKLIFVEGTLIFYFEEIVKFMSLKIFMQTKEKVRFTRRLNRDIIYRARTEESIHKQYYKTVKPMYDKYVRPLKSEADLIISGESNLTNNRNKIIREINSMIKGNL
tara:strand:- start:2553 stop:3173 length:621 start_codon:yes stop_codon:yes gene_type:complete